MRVSAGSGRAVFGEGQPAPGDLGDLPRKRGGLVEGAVGAHACLSEFRSRDVSRETCRWERRHVRLDGTLDREGQSTVARKTRVSSGTIPSTEREDLHVTQAGFSNDLLRGDSLLLDARALHEHQLAAGANQRQRSSGSACESAVTARAVTWSSGRRWPGLLRACSEHRDVAEPEPRRLVVQPGNASLHGLDQDEVDVRPGDREHQAREAGAASDIADEPRSQQGRGEHAVQDVARPEPRRLERADQSEFLAARGEFVGEGACQLDAVAEEAAATAVLARDRGSSESVSVSRRNIDRGPRWPLASRRARVRTSSAVE